jgi:very-short-patch-repair endonuclease
MSPVFVSPMSPVAQAHIVELSIHQLVRQQRQEQTQAERRLWHRLRERRLGGFRFRRQFPIGDLIVDFCCREQGLVVEVDGGQHLKLEEAGRNRSKLIEARGCRVMPFWNSDVLANVDGVLEQILSALRPPTP